MSQDDFPSVLQKSSSILEAHWKPLSHWGLSISVQEDDGDGKIRSKLEKIFVPWGGRHRKMLPGAVWALHH